MGRMYTSPRGRNERCLTVIIFDLEMNEDSTGGVMNIATARNASDETDTLQVL